MAFAEEAVEREATEPEMQVLGVADKLYSDPQVEVKVRFGGFHIASILVVVVELLKEVEATGHWSS